MRSATVQDLATDRARRWSDATIGLLDEHHVAAWSRGIKLREEFALQVGRAMRRMADTETVVIAGAVVRDLPSFCRQLQRGLAEAGVELPVRRSVDGAGGVVDALRERGPSAPAAKRRYYIWHDADVLLRHDAALFGRLVDALAGVAAEAEYASEDLLLIHRALFVGGPSLDLYGENEQGQFRSWLRDPQASPLPRRGAGPAWGTVSGLGRPQVKRLAIA